MTGWPADLLIGTATGAVLGGFFFGGLMWTIRRLPGSRRPALMAGVSVLGRVAVLSVGLVFVAQGRALRIAFALLGILLVRWALVRRWSLDDAEGEAPWT